MAEKQRMIDEGEEMDEEEMMMMEEGMMVEEEECVELVDNLSRQSLSKKPVKYVLQDSQRYLSIGYRPQS